MLSVIDLFCELGKLQENLITELQKSKENETTRPVRLAKQLIMENYSTASRASSADRTSPSASSVYFPSPNENSTLPNRFLQASSC